MKAIVVGYSLSGKAAAQLLVNKKYEVNVYEDNLEVDTFPFKNISVYKNLFDALADVSLVVLSPAVSFESKIVTYSRKCGIEVISEVELAYRFSNHDIVAVTGTNGKTTTTLLIKDLLINAGIDAHEVGNIGKPYSSELKDMTESSVAVLELSSFQLEGIVSFKSKYAICLNVTEDHLTRHKTMNIYSLCKQKIFVNQESEDVAILNYDDYIVRGYAERVKSKVYFFSSKSRVKGAFIYDGYICVEFKKFEKIMKIEDLSMKGNHNIMNALAAVTFAKLLNVNNDTIKKVLSCFKAPSFRIEYLGKIKGKNVYNDSKATNIDSTIKACCSIDEDLTLIVGGFDKGISYDKLFSQLPKNVKHIIFFGDNTYTMMSFMPDDICFSYQIATTMSRAVSMAFDSDNPCILFSPSTSSFDRYSSYVERGEDFNNTVKDYYNC